MVDVVLYVFLALSTTFGPYIGSGETPEECAAERERIVKIVHDRADEAGAVYVDAACRKITLKRSGQPA